MSFDIHIITRRHSDYPKLLREIAAPPKQLYVRGNIELLHHPLLLAVVGSRKANSYGKQVTNKLLPSLVKAGLPLVSGLAFGIDSLAHRACLDEGQPTIAVLGTGVDDRSMYPRTHLALAEKILATGGTIISEYPPGTGAYKSNFPARNRIIAGLCQTTLVVQASLQSGSLITARFALDSNRNVCAVPGPITDPLSAGTNSLIQRGAYPIVVPADLLHLYGLEEGKGPREIVNLSLEQQKLYAALNAEAQHIDELVAALHLPAQQVASLLMELELLGSAEHVGGMKYVKK